LGLINKKTIDEKNVVDTLEIARAKYPGSQNSLDALCKRFNINNTKREKHSALVDCNLLKEVYVNLLDQKEPKLNLENDEITNLNFNDKVNINNLKLRKIVKPNNNELELHKKYLKSLLPRNYFN
jgi:DNA polymerase-3 subunit epsilon